MNLNISQSLGQSVVSTLNESIRKEMKTDMKEMFDSLQIFTINFKLNYQ